MSNPDPYRDYDPERAKYMGWWFAIALGTLLIFSGLIYYAGRSNNFVSNLPPAGTSEPSTTGSTSSAR